MTHTDLEVLAMLALDERAGTAAERAHVRTCSLCALELTQLRRVVEVARGAASSTISQPSPRVWTAILDELDAQPSAGPTDDRRRAAEEDATPGRPGPSEPHLRTAPAAAELRASASLLPVDTSPFSVAGDAEVATDDRGRRLLQVTLRTALPADGVRQAWLVHQDEPGRRQSVGIFDGPHGLWTIDRAIDLELFSILEVSQEPLGSTQFSGQTIARGAISAEV